MLIDVLRENIRNFYWDRVCLDDKVHEYIDITNKAEILSKDGIDCLIRNSLSPIVKECLMAQGLKVTCDEGEYIISWRINNE